MHHGPELTAVIVFCAALAVGALTRAISKRTKFPYTVAMLGVGMAAGLGLEYGDVEAPVAEFLTSGHALSADLIIFVFLPALIFESAFALDVHAFRKNIGFVLFLAVPALLVATLLTALWMLGVTAGPLGLSGWNWGWGAALVFGALISATDPVAVVAILREVGAPKRLGLLIEGESLFNDGTAIVAFTVLLSLLAGGGFDSQHAAFELLRVAGGGVAVGLVLAWVIGNWLARTFQDALVEITLTLVLAYAAMIFAEAVLHVSGVLAIVTAGVYLAGPGRTRISPEVAHFLHQFWELLAYIANTVIFLLVGFLIASHLHTARPSTLGVIALGFVGIIIIRFLVVFTVLPIANRLLDQPVDRRSAAAMAWGGLRGAVSLALALVVAQHPDVDEELGVQILSVTAGIVLLTIAVNGTTTGWFLQKLGLTRIGAAEALADVRAAERLLTNVEARVDEADADPALRTVPWQEVRAGLRVRRVSIEEDLGTTLQRFDEAGAIARAAGVWQRALGVERRFYRAAYIDGTIGPRALGRLEIELDQHFDRIEADDFEAPPSRLAEPGWVLGLEHWVRTLGLPFGRLAFHVLSLRYDVARVIAEAAARVRSELVEVRADDPEAVDSVSAVYRRYADDALHVLEDLRVHMPELATAIESRLARRIALSFEKSAVDALRAEGAIGEAVAERLSADLKRRAKGLHFAATRVELPETAEICRETALFADLDDDVVDELAKMTIEQVFVEGEELFRERDRGDGMYIVARGVVEVFHPGVDDAPETVLASLGGGDILGEMALLSGEPRTASARAATAVTVGRISTRDFRQLMETRPEVEEKMWSAFGRRLLDNQLRAGAFGNLTPAARRLLMAGCAGRALSEGASLIASGGGLFVVDGELETEAGVRRAGALIDPGESLRARTGARVLRLPQLTRASGAEEERGAP
ncbi:MAG: cation:proton antiporter [Deltaproteobacteria bacterium]|nr:cation:proton antiporter [Deltaproteobacteria bacterium]